MSRPLIGAALVIAAGFVLAFLWQWLFAVAPV